MQFGFRKIISDISGLSYGVGLSSSKTGFPQGIPKGTDNSSTFHNLSNNPHLTFKCRHLRGKFKKEY